ncbi:MAG: Ig-like domain-containing protein [Prevotella sp.]|nr:Ig-like domain-containing protein [Prevotella sp.]
MKTKSLLLTGLFAIMACVPLNAQEILKGDMNDDNAVTIADVTSLVNVILGKAPQEKINVGGDPYKVDNTSVVGTWYAPDGTSFEFKEDGTTTFPGGATYEFMPMQGRLLVFDAMKNPVKVLPLLKVESQYLLTVDYATSVFTYYTNSGSLATGITISPSTLEMNSGTTAQLMASLTPEGAFGSVTWTSSNESVATVDGNGVVTAVAGGTCTITATAGGSLKKATCSVTVKQLVTSIVLSQTTAVLELDGFVRLTATVLPENAANKNVVWSSSNEDVAPVRNGRVDAYGYGTAIITCEAADGSGVKATCRVNVPKTEYVDLGLPSGTLWATYNIGADSPEDYGDYFAWGETEGYNDGKTKFDWSTYKWCEGSNSTMTKYCTNSSYGYNGFTDDKTELDLEDDAAYVNWGPKWRMPSEEQFSELINSSYTTTEWTTMNGVNGRKITSNTNGNSIFLPAAGYRDNSSLFDGGSGGDYWSRTLYSDGPSIAWGLYFHSGGVYTSDYRYYGQSVRPVRRPE